MIWKLLYSPILTYSEKPPFKKNQWQHFSNKMICTEKLAQQADVYEKWKEMESAVYSEIAINPYAYEKTFLQSRKFIYPGNYSRTTWNETIRRRRTNSMKYWIKHVLNVWAAESNLIIQWKHHFCPMYMKLEKQSIQCFIASPKMMRCCREKHVPRSIRSIRPVRRWVHKRSSRSALSLKFMTPAEQ